MMTIETTSPKDLLDRDEPVTVGDFVTTDDQLPVFVYVVKEIKNGTATLYGISLTETKDDVYIYEMTVDVNNLLHLGESFVNQNGALCKIRNKVLAGKTDEIPVMPMVKAIL